MTDDTQIDVTLSSTLTSNFMLASLKLRQWNARKTDRDATDDLLAQKGAASNSASVIKSLLAGNDKELKDVHSAYTRVRTWFYASTLPWTSDNQGAQRGDRLVPVPQAMGFLGEFATLKAESTAALDKFLAVYDTAVANAAVSLGQLYDPNAYPSKDVVEGMFGMALEVNPLPEVEDFSRISLPAQLTEGLKDIYAQRAQSQVDVAVEDLQSRLLKELDRVATQLGKVARGEKARLHKSLITNVQGFVRLARSMGDLSPDLAELADKVDTSVLSYGNVNAFKENAALAAKVVSDVRDITADVTAPAEDKSTVTPKQIESTDGEDLMDVMGRTLLLSNDPGAQDKGADVLLHRAATRVVEADGKSADEATVEAMTQIGLEALAAEEVAETSSMGADAKAIADAAAITGSDVLADVALELAAATSDDESEVQTKESSEASLGFNMDDIFNL